MPHFARAALSMLSDTNDARSSLSGDSRAPRGRLKSRSRGPARRLAGEPAQATPGPGIGLYRRGMKYAGQQVMWHYLPPWRGWPATRADAASRDRPRWHWHASDPTSRHWPNSSFW
jgi:hypothetical protein